MILYFYIFGNMWEKLELTSLEEESKVENNAKIELESLKNDIDSNKIITSKGDTLFSEVNSLMINDWIWLEERKIYEHIILLNKNIIPNIKEWDVVEFLGIEPGAIHIKINKTIYILRNDVKSSLVIQ